MTGRRGFIAALLAAPLAAVAAAKVAAGTKSVFATVRPLSAEGGWAAWNGSRYFGMSQMPVANLGPLYPAHINYLDGGPGGPVPPDATPMTPESAE